MNDVADQPALPCQQVNVCLPNCPEGYRQARHSSRDVDGEPPCEPAKTDTLCSPIDLRLIYVHAVPVVWHWRVEISEKCAASRLRAPIQPVYERIEEQLRGEAVGKFRVVVGLDGKVTGSTLLSGGYTIVPPNVEPNPLRPNVFSDLAAKTLNRLRFRPYLIRGSAMEFQTTVTIPFKLRK